MAQENKEIRELNKGKLKNLIKVVTIWVLIVIVTYLFLILSITIINDKINYANYKYSYYAVEEVEQSTLEKINNIENPHIDYTRKEIKQIVSSNLKFKNYIYIEADNFSDGRLGRALVPLNSIIVKPNISDKEEYAIMLTHELIHLKYHTTNETFTQFMTFKHLYESNNEYLKYASKILALDIFNGEYSHAKQYDCGYYIIKYLEEKVAEND